MLKFYKNKKDLIERLIKENDFVLDVGFWGQGISADDKNWPHNYFLEKSRNVYGLDLDFQEAKLKKPENYKKGSAEKFDYDFKFDVIYGGDLIEHLSNPGVFLESCRRNLKNDGVLILTTPNCFNLFNLAEKLTKREPTVNHDHTFYFNNKTLLKLLVKNNFKAYEVNYIYSLGVNYIESYKKKFLNLVYYLLAKFTDKYLETLVIIAKIE